jgi:hypothetical protein
VVLLQNEHHHVLVVTVFLEAVQVFGCGDDGLVGGAEVLDLVGQVSCPASKHRNVRIELGQDDRHNVFKKHAGTKFNSFAIIESSLIEEMLRKLTMAFIDLSLRRMSDFPMTHKGVYTLIMSPILY